MIEIKMITSAAGPMGTFVSGKTYKVPNELAESFVAGGYATAMLNINVVKPPEPEKAVVVEIEHADADADAVNESKKAPVSAIWGKK